MNALSRKFRTWEFRTAKVPYGEISVQRKFRTAKNLYSEKAYGKISYGKISYGENSYGENSGNGANHAVDIGTSMSSLQTPRKKKHDWEGQHFRK